jgi:hypothetical protein
MLIPVWCNGLGIQCALLCGLQIVELVFLLFLLSSYDLASKIGKRKLSNSRFHGGMFHSKHTNSVSFFFVMEHVLVCGLFFVIPKVFSLRLIVFVFWTLFLLGVMDFCCFHHKQCL